MPQCGFRTCVAVVLAIFGGGLKPGGCWGVDLVDEAPGWLGKYGIKNMGVKPDSTYSFAIAGCGFVLEGCGAHVLPDRWFGSGFCECLNEGLCCFRAACDCM